MHVLIGLRAGVWCGSAHSGAPWTPPTARGMLMRVRRPWHCLLRAPCWRTPVLWRRGGNQGSTFTSQVTVLRP